MATMNPIHLVLLGDSIFDNAAYVARGLSVTQHLERLLPRGARVTRLAVDGHTSSEVPVQASGIPADATHLALSVGGNDALGALTTLSTPVSTVFEALGVLVPVVKCFREDYQRALRSIVAAQRPLLVCTVYDRIPGLAPALLVALSIFNDIITHEALGARLPLLDLRRVCTEAGDYSSMSPIEPSDRGGEKIAQKLARWALASA